MLKQSHIIFPNGVLTTGDVISASPVATDNDTARDVVDKQLVSHSKNML